MRFKSRNTFLINEISTIPCRQNACRIFHKRYILRIHISFYYYISYTTLFNDKHNVYEIIGLKIHFVFIYSFIPFQFKKKAYIFVFLKTNKNNTFYLFFNYFLL